MPNADSGPLNAHHAVRAKKIIIDKILRNASLRIPNPALRIVLVRPTAGSLTGAPFSRGVDRPNLTECIYRPLRCMGR